MSGLGLPRVHLRETDSTNQRARQLAESGAAHGTLVTASSQSSGRGRQGRAWSAPAGSSLLMSLVLRDPHPLLPLATGVAVADALAIFGFDAKLKWPNDVHLDGRKVAGILAEGRPAERWAVIGVGINVAVELNELPTELQETAATMGLAPTAVEDVLTSLLAAMELRYSQTDGPILDAFSHRDALVGKQINWSGGVGVASGIDGTGRLVVDCDGVRNLLDSGEVHLGSI